MSCCTTIHEMNTAGALVYLMTPSLPFMSPLLNLVNLLLPCYAANRCFFLYSLICVTGLFVYSIDFIAKLPTLGG